MSKVFISQESLNIDYTEAKKFGEVEFVTDLEFSLVDSSLKNRRIMDRIREVESAFNPLEDFVVMTGSPITFGIFFHRLALKAAGLGMPIKLLVWDRRLRQYKSVVLTAEFMGATENAY